MSNILEEYLVRIGAEVDKDAFAGAAKAINNLSGMLGKLALFLNMALSLRGWRRSRKLSLITSRLWPAPIWNTKSWRNQCG